MRTNSLAKSLLVVAALLGTLPSCSKLRGQADGGDEGGGAAGGGALGSGLAFLNGFEGQIDGFIKDNKPADPQTSVSLFIKSSKIRFEVPEKLSKSAAGSPFGAKGYVIVDSPAKKLYFVSDAEKQAMLIDLNNAGKMVPPSAPTPPNGHGGTAPAGPVTKITKTGKTDTVAGYKCEYWDIASDHKEGTVCVADEGASWLSLPLTGIPTERAWMMELMDGKHFPLRFVGYAKDGATEENRVEITKIDKKSLADSEFQVPAGYKIIDLEKMMQGMGMPGGGGFPGPHPPPHTQH